MCRYRPLFMRIGLKLFKKNSEKSPPIEVQKLCNRFTLEPSMVKGAPRGLPGSTV
jgi:hypothetical protein